MDFNCNYFVELATFGNDLERVGRTTGAFGVDAFVVASAWYHSITETLVAVYQLEMAAIAALEADFERLVLQTFRCDDDTLDDDKLFHRVGGELADALWNLRAYFKK